MTVIAAILVACGGSSTGFNEVPPDVENETGASFATFYPEPVVFDGIVTVTVSEYMKVANDGDNTLSVYSIDISDAAEGQFNVEDIGQFSLEPGNEREWFVTCTLNAAKPAVGELRIQTGAENAIDHRIELQCNPSKGGSDSGG